jgi:hypothetical protein
MPLVWEQAHGRASMHTGGVGGRGPGRVGLLCWREIGFIMLAGFQEDRAGMEKGGDASVNRLRSHFFFLEIF